MDKNVKHYPLAHDVEMPQHCAYVVRDLPQATVEQRERALNATHWNEFAFPAGLLTVDMLSDSGTTAMTNQQWATLMLGDEAYGRNTGYYVLLDTFRDIFERGGEKNWKKSIDLVRTDCRDLEKMMDDLFLCEYEGGLFNGGANNLWIIIGIVVSFVIMLAGISNGIEASCKIMLPILYVLFVVLAIVMIFIPGTAEGYKYIFTLDPKSLLNPEVWVYAFGQCFFSLSVAGSGSVVYGSYLGKDVKIRQSAVICAILDTSCALLAMFVIIPAMATTGADLGNGGPGLMFVSVLPVFNGIGGISRLIVIFFYVAILFAGISSIINLFETPVNFLQQQLHLKRWMAVGLIHVVGLIVALLIQPWTSQWMDIVSIYILPLGAVAAGIMFFWVMKKKDALAAAQLGSDKPIMKWFMPFGKYVFVPLCIACFVLGIWWGGIG